MQFGLAYIIIYRENMTQMILDSNLFVSESFLTKFFHDKIFYPSFHLKGFNKLPRIFLLQ